MASSALTAPAVLCASCAWPLPPEAWSQSSGSTGSPWKCRVCGNAVHAAVFPAIRSSAAPAAPEPRAGESEAACFYHAHSRAEKPCDECGRFLCRLCELEAGGRTLCPVCFNHQAGARKIHHFDNRRTMHDTAALALATLPALLFWPVIATAPMALFWVFRFWNAPGSIVPRTRIRFYLAALFALAEIAGIVLLIAVIVVASRVGRGGR